MMFVLIFDYIILSRVHQT